MYVIRNIIYKDCNLINKLKVPKVKLRATTEGIFDVNNINNPSPINNMLRYCWDC